jgi:glucuronokinase
MHGGAVLAIPVPALTVTVKLADSAAPLPLIDAALARVGVESGYEWSSDIPRSVGLAGSSALVIAALRATGRAPEDPLELAQLALSIERDDLGIPAGLQDRATQAFDHPVLVDGDTVRPLTAAAPLEFLVAWCDDASEDSGEYHRGREMRADAVKELARIARRAADAFTAGDAAALEALMDESARVRDEVAPLSPAHNALAERLRARGLSPNSTGSGGAVVAVLR